MISVPIFDAKNKLPQYVHQVESGEQIELTRYNKKVAILLSNEDYDQMCGGDNFISVYRLYKNKIIDLYKSHPEINLLEDE
jgi:prevent-host-death family protein